MIFYLIFQKKVSNSHFGMIALWERLSCREKSWQDATHTAFYDKAGSIMRIAEKKFFELPSCSRYYSLNSL